jgi:hypothetical protein
VRPSFGVDVGEVGLHGGQRRGANQAHGGVTDIGTATLVAHSYSPVHCATVGSSLAGTYDSVRCRSVNGQRSGCIVRPSSSEPNEASPPHCLPGHFMQRLEPVVGSLLDAATATERPAPTSTPRNSCMPLPCCANPCPAKTSPTTNAWLPSSPMDCGAPPTRIPSRDARGRAVPTVATRRSYGAVGSRLTIVSMSSSAVMCHLSQTRWPLDSKPAMPWAFVSSNAP